MSLFLYLFMYIRIRLLLFLYVFFIQEVQVLKALVLGEEERGQSQYQVMCFATKFRKSDFISSDAMAKLRQVCIPIYIYVVLNSLEYYYILYLYT